MSDKETTIQELKEILNKFKEERNWGQFHDAKNLAEAISIESGELQEHFLWKKSVDVMSQLESDPKFKDEVSEELADVVMYCLNFANAINIDLSSTIKNKIKKNNEKYPVEKSKGNAKKYNQL